MSGPNGYISGVHILVATDADHVVHGVTAALGGPQVSFTICREGRDVSSVVARGGIDVAVLDLQIGSMGGMAVAMALRLDHSAGRLPATRVLMLLDRQADVHLARRSAADTWLVKPLDALALKRAVAALMAPPPAEAAEADAGEAGSDDESEAENVGTPEGETVAAG
jgi:two-component system nitrate/nitrite response regulator NarL